MVTQSLWCTRPSPISIVINEAMASVSDAVVLGGPVLFDPVAFAFSRASQRRSPSADLLYNRRTALFRRGDLNCRSSHASVLDFRRMACFIAPRNYSLQFKTQFCILTRCHVHHRIYRQRNSMHRDTG